MPAKTMLNVPDSPTLQNTTAIEMPSSTAYPTQTTTKTVVKENIDTSQTALSSKT